MTLLSVIDACDNFSLLTTTEKLIPFYLAPGSGTPIGWLFLEVYQLIKDYARSSKLFPETNPFEITSHSVSFTSKVDTFEARSVVCKKLCETWRDDGLFSEVIGGRLWRDELYAIYASPFRDISTKSAVFTMERVCCALFGLVTYGVHLTMYTDDGRLWVPRRSRSKQTWGGFLDNSVAGGIPHGLTPKESLVKECMEEASLTEDIACQAKAAGCVSYFNRTSKGWLQPEVQYVFDLCVPSPDGNVVDRERYVPRPLDGEVESFELIEVEEVIRCMSAGEFKPNCALVITDFLIRHGHITSENEPNYFEIVTRLHGRYGFDGWIAKT